MNGIIGVDSILGSGSKFWFEVRLKKGKLRNTPKSTPVQEGHARLVGNVLVAEDNHVNQKLVVGLLRARGLGADVVSNGHEAIEKLGEKCYDLIFMDCHMPDMDGFSATAIIRSHADSKIRQVPIVALTADVSKGTEKKCLDYKMNSYLRKPIDIAEFNKVLDHYLKPAPAATPILDVAFLQRLEVLNATGEPDMILELTDDYLNESPKIIAEIQSAVLVGDFALVKKLAHKLKSSTGQLGLATLSKSLAELEDDSQNSQKLAKALSLFPQAREELQAFRKKRVA